MPVAEFEFESFGRHVVRVEGDWTGSERYFVDGQLAHRYWSLFGGTRSFSACGANIEIRVGLARNLRSIESSAFVDGKLVAQDIFNVYNQQVKEFGSKVRGSAGQNRSVKVWLAKVVVWAIVGFVVFSVIKYFQTHAT